MTERTHARLDASTRRRFLGAVGAAGIAATVPTAAVGDDGSTSVVDDELDVGTDELQEALVVFETADDVDRLAELDLAEGFLGFDRLPIGYAQLTGDQLLTVAGWDEVRRVAPNRELECFNDDGRETTRASEVQDGEGLNSAYTGENVHVAVIDTGVDGAHPDLEDNLAANWQWVGNLEDEPDGVLWEDAEALNTDDNGHGTHCCGTVGGDGTESDGEYKGMAPEATLTSYSANVSLTLATVVSAYDHLIERKESGEADVQIVSNSYGLARSDDYDPWDPGNVATWYAFEAGILPVFAAGNDGPDRNTLNYYVRGPHVLGAAATDDEKAVVDFSSRGRGPDDDGETNADRELALENHVDLYRGVPAEELGPVGIYRNGVGAKGADVMSTLNPAHPLQAYDVDDEVYYGLLSGTSMACPGVAGCAALVADAYYENHGAHLRPVDLLATIEATAREDARDDYAAASIGAGFVDAHAAVERAEAGDVATLDEVELAPRGG
ncbi:S8 family serine peptidase [Halovivax sp.]|uniref:S8 family peptidase n=1 Tax=Halovivax sp. TaxID=1935978 RepID=UPI0025BCDA3D|nr:S8 family serine peptidase [Halovivax sp.]